mmetsp:Transcript_23593/g.70568  ORF Transcript_23593/g.70568 Transcript_23593/m.70568 type:complete len:218 (+) Transcript_23593:324-977(+)
MFLSMSYLSLSASSSTTRSARVCSTSTWSCAARRTRSLWCRSQRRSPSMIKHRRSWRPPSCWPTRSAPRRLTRRRGRSRTRSCRPTTLWCSASLRSTPAPPFVIKRPTSRCSCSASSSWPLRLTSKPVSLRSFAPRLAAPSPRRHKPRRCGRWREKWKGTACSSRLSKRPLERSWRARRPSTMPAMGTGASCGMWTKPFGPWSSRRSFAAWHLQSCS